jgi:hypothetical protein
VGWGFTPQAELLEDYTVWFMLETFEGEGSSPFQMKWRGSIYIQMKWREYFLDKNVLLF